MNEPFIIPVIFQGTEHEFKARFERYGYANRITVLIDEHTYVFEPDEEGSYRAMHGLDNHRAAQAGDISLLQAVAEKLAKLSV